MPSYHLLNPLATRTLDTRWFDQLVTAGLAAGEVYTVLGPTSAELHDARKVFDDSGKTSNVSHRPTTAGLAAFRDTSTELLALRDRIGAEESDDVVRQVYLNRIDELLLYLRSVRAARDNDTAGFMAANTAIYGKPDPAIAAAVIGWLRDFLYANLIHPDVKVRSAIQLALRHVPEAWRTSVALLPDEATFRTVKRLHYAPGGYFDQLLDGAPEIPRGTVTAATGDIVVQQVLRNIGSDYAVMDSPDTLWGVVHSRRAVLQPAGYHLSKPDFYDLIVHEVGSHTLEYVNGHRAALRLLATGLDRYDHANEGRAYLREQLLHTSPDAITTAHSWEHHILIHLAIWLADTEDYDFAGLYHVIQPLALVWERLRNTDEAAGDAAAHDIAWGVLSRALKGTDGTGGAYYKDIIYVQGNVRCWQAAETHPELILFGDAGKFDPTRQDHLDILSAIGLRPIPPALPAPL